MLRSSASKGLVIVALASVSLVLRFRSAGADCLWFDEIFSVHAATEPLAGLLGFIALDLIHPPLYYLLLKGWIVIGGEGVEWLRTLSIVVYLLALIPFILLSRELKLNLNAILISLCFLLFNGTLFKYSLEVRMYGLVLCTSLFSIYLFIRFSNRETGLAMLFLANVLLVYCHYFGWFVVLSEVALAAIFFQKKLKAILFATTLVAVSYLPWLYLIYTHSQSGQGLSQNIGWIARPGLREIITLGLNLVEPFYYQLTTGEPISIFWISLPMSIFLVGVAIAVITTSNKESKRNIMILAGFVIIPLVFAFILSWVGPHSIWGTRHLTIVFVPAFLLIGIMISRISSDGVRHVFHTVLLLIFLLGGINHIFRERPVSPWCEIAPLVSEKGWPEIPVVAVEDLIAYQLWFASRNEKTSREIVKLSGIDGVVEDTAYFLPRGFNDVRKIEIESLDLPTFMLITRGREISQSEAPIRNLLVKGYEIQSQKTVFVGTEMLAVLIMQRK